ncbi:MAG: MerR family transcriptional regulator [Lentisphaerae bacterium]|nr:MerR family transcriptional regulator [Lentisphaerota bacterium]MCP4102719.1 MerR family transcriptional regulator [Lentisphaerota bacterium]
MMYKINEITKLIGLSRSTLLYYEKTGLIVPHKNRSNDYRIYSKNDLKNLRKVCLYRSMGINLNEIKNIIFEENTDIKNLLEEQLEKINVQIHDLRLQQNRILKIIKMDNASFHSSSMDKSTWIKILKKSGLDEKGLEEWHRSFEKLAPKAHKDFLQGLKIPEEEIKKIRQWSSK